MDCNLAETLMMKHMDKIISKQEAADLARHIDECESCREYYLAFDQTMEAMATITEVAPANFTAAVMTEIRKMPAYTKPEPVRVVSIMHMFWGASAVLVAIALFFGYNPHYITDLANQYHIFQHFVNAANNTMAFLSQLTESIMQNQQTQTIGSSFAVGALAFVLILGVLLVTLHKEEGIA